MPLLTMTCPICQTKIDVSAQKVIAYCPCCGQRILRSDYAMGQNDKLQKTTEIKVRDVSRIEKGFGGELEIFRTIFRFILFAICLANEATLLFYVFYLLYKMPLNTSTSTPETVEEPKPIDHIQFRELVIKPSDCTKLYSYTTKRIDDTKHIAKKIDNTHEVRFEIKRKRYAYLSESEIEERKSGEYFAKEFGNYSIGVKDDFVFRYRKGYYFTYYATYCCSENAYYELTARCDRRLASQWEDYIFDTFKSVELVEIEEADMKPESFRSRVLELDRKQS